MIPLLATVLAALRRLDCYHTFVHSQGLGSPHSQVLRSYTRNHLESLESFCFVFLATIISVPLFY